MNSVTDSIPDRMSSILKLEWQCRYSRTLRLVDLLADAMVRRHRDAATLTLAAQLPDALVEDYDNTILAAKTPTLQENLNAAELCPPGTGET